MAKASRAAAMSGNNGSACSQSPAFLPEDIMINIILRLPTASCIARFRCVCRSWRILLSDPQFIHRFLFFQNPDDLKSRQILFTCQSGSVWYGVPARFDFSFSLHSYDTLGLISAGDLPAVPGKSLSRPRPSYVRVVGCCNGIFCIADENPGAPSDFLLWNPATSETKLIGPRTTCPSYRRGIETSEEITGFGYDPETDDYKVVRILRLELGCYMDDDGVVIDLEAAERDFPHPIPFTYAEVYSLRNDSWKKLNVSEDLADNAREVEYVHQAREVSRNERCYWFQPWKRKSCLVSFDMSREVFECTSFDHHPGMPFRSCLCMCFLMLKGSLVVTFIRNHHRGVPYQVWGLLKLGVADSWTKLRNIAPLVWPCVRPLEAWKEGAYICSKQMHRGADHVYVCFPEPPSLEEEEEEEEEEDFGGPDYRYVAFPEVPSLEEEEEVGDCIQILGPTHPLQALSYTPTQASLSLSE